MSQLLNIAIDGISYGMVLFIIAVGLSVTDPTCLEACAATCAALRAAGVGVPIFVGGQAVESDAHAAELGADGHAPDAAAMIALIKGRGRRAM